MASPSSTHWPRLSSGFSCSFSARFGSELNVDFGDVLSVCFFFWFDTNVFIFYFIGLGIRKRRRHEWVGMKCFVRPQCRYRIVILNSNAVVWLCVLLLPPFFMTILKMNQFAASQKNINLWIINCLDARSVSRFFVCVDSWFVRFWWCSIWRKSILELLCHLDGWMGFFSGYMPARVSDCLFSCFDLAGGSQRRTRRSIEFCWVVLSFGRMCEHVFAHTHTQKENFLLKSSFSDSL